MIINVIEPCATLLTDITGAEQFLEICGRTCYRSKDRITDESASKFVRMICRNHHESVLEHVNVSAVFICSRACSHQLVRHRIGSYCLSGDTVVPSMNQKKWTLRRLYEMASNPQTAGRVEMIRLRSMDENGRLVPGRIKTVVYTGENEVFKVTTKFGRSIKATSDHVFFTPQGEMKLRDLAVGSKVYANGEIAYKNKDWLEQKYIVENMERKDVAALAGVSDACIGQWVRRFGLQKPRDAYPNRRPGHGVKGMHSDAARADISLRMSGNRNYKWKGDNVGSGGGHIRAQKIYTATLCETCGRTDKLERHHVDGNPANNHQDNILILCQKCHKHWHLGQGVKSVFIDEIVSIEPAGVEPTYDLEMEEIHNFVAEGFVVHNSQESQRYVNYEKKGYEVICPPELGIPVGEYCGTRLPYSDGPEVLWLHTLFNNFRAYEQMMAAGLKPEDARYLLPNAMKTEVVATYNLRTWRHIFRERALNKHAQWEIRGMMLSLLDLFLEAVPSVFEDLTSETK